MILYKHIVLHLVILFLIAVCSITNAITIKMSYQQWASLSSGEQEKLIESENNKSKLPKGAGPKLVLSDEAQEKYKKNLRYQMWAQRRKGYNSENEGIYLSENLAEVIRKNASNFFDFNFK